MRKALPADRVPQALVAVAAWRKSPAELVACPACHTPGLVIVDRSARPYAEWYVLTCSACGLDHLLHIPLATPIVSLD